MWGYYRPQMEKNVVYWINLSLENPSAIVLLHLLTHLNIIHLCIDNIYKKYWLPFYT